MKSTLLALFLAFATLTSLQAQDIITKRTGEKIETKVLEISDSEIKYKRLNNLEGPTYVLAKADVMLIQYADKTTETFELQKGNQVSDAISQRENKVATETPMATAQLYNQGQTDATVYYDGYKTASTAVLITSLVSPLIGLIPAIATSTTPPKTESLDAPNNTLLQQPDYASGYRKNARKIKSGKVWKNWGIGLGVNLVAAILIANQ